MSMHPLDAPSQDQPSSSRTRRWGSLLLPPLVVAGAILVLAVAIALKPKPPKVEPRKVLPRIETMVVTQEDVPLVVRTQGTVYAPTRTTLTARVSGQVVRVSPSLSDGARMLHGETLLEIDPLPYEAAMAEAEAALARASLSLAQEEAASAQARIDWELNAPGRDPSSLVLRQPQLARAQADLSAARTQHRLAQRNLEDTRVRAPYDGRVVLKRVDLGQVVAAQSTPLAEVYATAEVEVRLPVDLGDLALLDRAQADKGPLPVTLTALFGPQRYQWKGRIVRTSGAVQESSRMAFVVARVDQPDPAVGAGPPLYPGLFIQAEILTGEAKDAFRIPRGALQPDGTLFRLSAEGRLHRIQPGIQRMDADWAVVTDGLEDGDQISLTPLLYFVDGMEVEVVPPVGSPSDEGGAGGPSSGADGGMENEAEGGVPFERENPPHD